MAQELVIRITGDSSGLKDATDDSTHVLEGFGKKVSALSVAAGTLLADGVRAGFGAVSGFVKDSIGAASDINETVSKVGVLFGDAAPQIEAFAATAATQFGQSKQQAMDAAATFATFGKAAGLGGSDLAGFSTQLVGLASDMASFGNTDVDTAIAAVGAALRGESEPIRQYGVMLDDATLKQEALSLGIISSTKEALTPANKVLAAQAAIMKQTTAAQGDFARTSDGLANKQRILSAQIGNLKTNVGQAFLPVVLSLTTALSTKLLPLLEKWGPLISTELAGGLRAFVSAFKAFDGDVTSSGFPGFMERVGYVVRWAVERFKEMWPTIKQVAAAIAGAVVVAARFANDLRVRFTEAFNTFRAVFNADGWSGVVQTALAGIRVAFNALGEWLRSTALPFLGEQAIALAKVLGGWVVAAAGYLAEHLPGWLATLAGWLAGTVLPWVAGKMLDLAKLLGGWVLDGIGYLLGNLPEWIGALVEWIVGTAVPTLLIEGTKLAISLAGWVLDSIAYLLENLPGWLLAFGKWVVTDAIPAMARFGVDAAQAIGKAFLGALGWVAGLAANIVDGLIDGLWRLASKLASAVGDFITDTIPGPIKKALGIGSPSKVAAGLGRNVAEGLALGITAGTELVAGASGRLAYAATPTMSGFTPQELPGGNWAASPIVVQTYLDGRQIATGLAPHQRLLERAKR